MEPKWIVDFDAPILVTGAAGFIGSRVVENLLERGFTNVRCLVRPSGRVEKLETLQKEKGVSLQLVRGNLLSREDCQQAVKDVQLVYHLAAGRGEKLVADAFMNSVVTTRNLIDACAQHGRVRRFVSTSSFSVYTNTGNTRYRLLDETCPIESRPALRGDAYSFAKVKQDELVVESCTRLKLPYVIVRPGVVYGPGNEGITGRVGLGSFGIFLHLGGGNRIPFTYVENCADAMVLAGLQPGVDGEAFNIVDDDLPTSRSFLRRYKREVRSFRSIYVPHAVSYLLCLIWEKYSKWSEEQLPPTYNRRAWNAYWKRTNYTNNKLKQRLGWQPKVQAKVAFDRFFEAARARRMHKAV